MNALSEVKTAARRESLQSSKILMVEGLPAARVISAERRGENRKWLPDCLKTRSHMSKTAKGPVSALVESFQALHDRVSKSERDLLASLADFDNFRRRAGRELEMAGQRAREELLSELIPVLDNFDRALELANTPSQNALLSGVELIHRQLRDVLSKFGLEEFSCLGQQFDPRRAEALGFVCTTESGRGTVVREHCRGYECGGRVLRPTRVEVAQPAPGEERTEEQLRSEEPEVGSTEEIGAPASEQDCSG